MHLENSSGKFSFKFSDSTFFFFFATLMSPRIFYCMNIWTYITLKERTEEKCSSCILFLCHRLTGGKFFFESNILNKKNKKKKKLWSKYRLIIKSIKACTEALCGFDTLFCNVRQFCDNNQVIAYMCVSYAFIFFIYCFFTCFWIKRFCTISEDV